MPRSRLEYRRHGRSGPATSAAGWCLRRGTGLVRPPAADELEQAQIGARRRQRAAGARRRARARPGPGGRPRRRLRPGRGDRRPRRRRDDGGQAPRGRPGRPRASRSCSATRRFGSQPRTGSPTPPSTRSTRVRPARPVAGATTSGAFSAAPAGSASPRPGTGWPRTASREASGPPSPSSTPALAYASAPGTCQAPTSASPSSSPGSTSSTTTARRWTRTATAPTSPGRSPSRPPGARRPRIPTSSPGSPTAPS